MNAFVPRYRLSAASFVGSVAARFTWRALLAGLALAATSLAFHLLMARYSDYALDQWSRFAWAGTIISGTMGIGVILAILCADEATRRGAPPALAYSIILVCTSVVSGILQLHIRDWFELSSLGDGNHSQTLRYVNMLYMALDTLVWGAFVMFAYAHWQRDSRYRGQVEMLQLDRLNVEQQLARSRLTATQAQIEPELLLTRLDSIKKMYEAASPDAEPLLDELIAHLRERLSTASAAVEAPRTGTPA